MKFERLKLRFGGRIAVTHARSAVRLRDDEFTELQAHWLSRHLRAAIGMHDGLSLHDSFASQDRYNKVLERVPHVLLGPENLADVPREVQSRRSCDEFEKLLGITRELTTLARLVVRA